MQNRNLTLLRISKQEHKLKQDPIPNAWIARDGTFDFHFVLHNLQDPYSGGYYHGVLTLNQNYPFAAPKLIFYTPTGRFMTNTPICTTFTNYHPQSWSSAWNVKTMVLATISFMLGNETGYGGLNSNTVEKRMLARQSLSFNLQNETFKRLFVNQLKQQNLIDQRIFINRDEPNLLLQKLNQKSGNQNHERRNYNWKKWGIIIGTTIIVSGVVVYLILY